MPPPAQEPLGHPGHNPQRGGPTSLSTATTSRGPPSSPCRSTSPSRSPGLPWMLPLRRRRRRLRPSHPPRHASSVTSASTHGLLPHLRRAHLQGSLPPRARPNAAPHGLLRRRQRRPHREGRRRRRLYLTTCMVAELQPRCETPPAAPRCTQLQGRGVLRVAREGAHHLLGPAHPGLVPRSRASSPTSGRCSGGSTSPRASSPAIPSPRSPTCSTSRSRVSPRRAAPFHGRPDRGGHRCGEGERRKAEVRADPRRTRRAGGQHVGARRIHLQVEPRAQRAIGRGLDGPELRGRHAAAELSVPALKLLHPTDPDGVFFFLRSCIFAVDLRATAEEDGGVLSVGDARPAA